MGRKRLATRVRAPIQSSPAANRSSNRDDSLLMHHLGSKCGDGSPAAIYSNQHAPGRDPSKHVFFVMKGSVCYTEADCQKVMQELPYKLSSKPWPPSVNGLSILSNNPVLNPVTHNYTFWMVPYCSQDAYLGSGTQDSNGIYKAGSVNLMHALQYWSRQKQDIPTIEKLLVVGSSAGALGVLNHLEEIRDTAQLANVKEMSIILDSSPLNGKDLLDDINHNSSTISEYLKAYVDPQVHPMCFETEPDGTPCCLSTHCILRTDPIIAQWSTETRGERMMLINSQYDPYEFSKMIQPPDGSSLSVYLQAMQKTYFVSGERAQRIAETASLLNGRPRPENATNTMGWLTTSCVMHPFLVPANFDVQVVDCDAVDKACRNGTTVGSVADIYQGQNLIIWNDPEVWTTKCVIGESIQSLIQDFVMDKNPPPSQELLVTFGDDCNGPNCVSDKSNMSLSPCQQFLELEDTFVPLPRSLKWVIAGLVWVASLIGFFMRFKPYAFVRKPKMDTEDANKERVTLAMRNLNVYDSKKDNYILSNVSFSIPHGAITAICGKSGAGKTTLLRAMVGQTEPNLNVSVDDSNFDFGKVCYVRQEDNCSLFNRMLASEFLDNNALLYGASASRLKEVKSKIASFQDQLVGHLSGGQRKRIAVCSALLMTPALVVLDEPLTGLDSVSSQEFLRFIIETVHSHGCSVVMTCHAPSNEIAQSFEKLIVVENGHLVVNTLTSKLWRTPEATLADDIHTLLENRASFRLGQEVGLIDDTCDVLPNAATTSQGQGLVTAILTLTERLRKEYGWAWNDFGRLPFTVFVLTIILSWDDQSLNQTLFATIFCLAACYNVFQYKISQACEIWRMHRSEILDGRISYLSYMIASKLYQFSPALLSLVPSLVIVYALLGWSFATFLGHIIFASMYLSISLQGGRVLSLWFDGSHIKYIKFFSLYLMINLMFSGTVVPINKFPSGFEFLYITSFTFWAVAGALLNQLQYGDHLGGDHCRTAVTCILSDNKIIARYLGYHPTTTPTMSLTILGLLYALLLFAEFLIGSRGSRRFARVEKTKLSRVSSTSRHVPPSSSLFVRGKTEKVESQSANAVIA
ncbi:ATP-binding protein [Seminavis robusta]|uniref:ATP-binding protein n=1 Tax=Seminavis robusta TaxID=568900 RepID=A0A9N8EPP0_9STRA|nr:ATP-binding protein [Seminavis robusta]|eukprot:Sro1713_g292990.1 ATP-binding protein (1088) ;mRNA; r:17811-21320